MSKCIILTGIPGSGKTTYALGIQSALEKVAIISSDDVRKSVTGSMVDGTKETLVWQEYVKQVIKASENHDIVIADSTALTNELRLKRLADFRPYFEKVELVVLDIPFAVCWERNIARERKVPLNPMAGMFKLFEEPSEEVHQNFDSVIIVKEEEKDTWKRS
jgi:predicted kinase